MSRHIAVVPAAILRRWDRIACAQLCAAATRLAQECDELKSSLEFAGESACMWQDIATAEREGRTAGITQDGRVVDVGVHA